MQRFPCPYCGPRDEREFHYAGDFGKQRPHTGADVSDSAWSDYLFSQKNRRGVAEEVWVHLPCQEYFRMTRDTTTMEVLGATSARREAT